MRPAVNRERCRFESCLLSQISEMLAVSEAASRDSLKVVSLVRIQDGQPYFFGQSPSR
jgi:hypothetical protein